MQSEKQTLKDKDTNIHEKSDIATKNKEENQKTKKNNKNNLNAKYEFLSVNTIKKDTIEKVEHNTSNSKNNSLNIITVKIQPDLLKHKNLFDKITASQDCKSP